MSGISESLPRAREFLAFGGEGLARFLVVHGRLQRAGEVIHVVAERFADLSDQLGEMVISSRDFH